MKEEEEKEKEVWEVVILQDDPLFHIPVDEAISKLEEKIKKNEEKLIKEMQKDLRKYFNER